MDSSPMQQQPGKQIAHHKEGILDEDELGLSNLNWHEVRLDSKVPERRGYHSTFEYQDKLYIFGGHDIREGFLNNLWMIDMQAFSDLDRDMEDQDKTCGWQLLQTHGKQQPEAISHHTSVVYGNQMYMFGGCLASGQENSNFWALNIDKLAWHVIKPKKGFVPESREEHTSCVYDSYMVIFGGFERGQRISTIAMYNFEKREWVQVQVDGVQPKPRAGHSAVVHDGKMWIFGGKSNDNDKLLDLWAFDFTKNQWEQIDFTMDPDVDIASRSGHSASIYQGHMIIFAGIHEVTHELDDMAAFNFKSKKWVHMFKEPNSKAQDSINQTRASKGKDPSTQSPQRISDIPMKKTSTQQNVQMNAIDKGVKKSQQAKKKKGMHNQLKEKTDQLPSPKKKQEADPNDYKILTDVTSITMMNSILIKNAGPQFENYHKSQLANKKQKSIFEASPTKTFNQVQQPASSMTPHLMGQVPEKNTYGKVEDRRPAARDGHTAVINNGRFIVFGGDRHQMPFNDLHFLQLDKEFAERGLMMQEQQKQ